MSRSSTRRRGPSTPVLAGAAVALLALVGFAALAEGGPTDLPPTPAIALPPVHARTGSVDTLFLGGYAEGSFQAAVGHLASDLSAPERAMVGRHLDRIFAPLLQGAGLGEGGRLRVAYERVRRPDGTTRSIQVLAAQAAVRGTKHTVFFYESGEKPGYYSDLGRSLDPVAWTGPLPVMRVTSPFRTDRMHPILRRVLPHLGVDYAAAHGTPVRATGDGSVSYAAVKGGYGKLVEVQHPNGYATRYAHLSMIAPGVRRGGVVQQGDVIGYVGATGLATGPHLHYEVRRKGQPVDPMLVQGHLESADDVGYERPWRRERRELARLLARTPTMRSLR